jgi:hypothetical protein
MPLRSKKKRQLLNFEAVDYRCEAFVNGKSVGSHVGGNLPFSFDATDALKDGENELVVRVEDDTEKFQLRGKQRLNARGIWYTQNSGIWQTVWLEEVPELFVQRVKVDTKTSGVVSVKIATEGRIAGKLEVTAIARLDGKEVARATGPADSLALKIAEPKLWTPNSPTLYDLEIRVKDDVVHSYFGVREVGKVKDADGHWRFTLNGDVVFHWGPLDQGWWPDGLLTPPSDEAMLFDIEWLKESGFNMIRKHIKVEPRRYYYHCDRLGMMVWQDQVSGGKNPKWYRLDPTKNKNHSTPELGDPIDAEWPDADHEQWMTELKGMIDHLYNYPSIVMWVPFNEAWGQHRTMEVGEWIMKYDPSRSINIASGGNFAPVGDIADMHSYPHPSFPFHMNEYDDYIKVVGELGGHGWKVDGHEWDPKKKNFIYGDMPKTIDEYAERYAESIRLLGELKAQGISGGVYTQTTDIEGEINGLMTYDRKVIKIPAEELAKLHDTLFTDKPDQAVKAEKPINPLFVQVMTDRKPEPVMDAETIRAGLKSHDRALYIKAGWIRDPYITIGPDDYYYLTGTQPREGDPREAQNPYNIGLGDASVVGDQVRAYRSKDLIEWESLGPIFSVDDTEKARQGRKIPKRLIWAPEVHWMPELGEDGRWALVHCPKKHSSLVLSEGKELKGPWTHSMKKGMGQRHDPSLFTDDDGTVYMLWLNTMIAPLDKDLTRYTADPVRIDPAGSRPGPDGTPISHIGHEGATMIKVGGKYVHLGTAWSTDSGRKGSYNLYYCVADKITGPYGPRKFAGRFLGHGTPFQTKDGKWWCTAFFNGNVPPLSREGIQQRDIGDNAQTINEQGVTVVPLDVRMLDNGEVYIRAKDPVYANPGPDEAQQFSK